MNTSRAIGELIAGESVTSAAAAANGVESPVRTAAAVESNKILSRHQLMC